MEDAQARLVLQRRQDRPGAVAGVRTGGLAGCVAGAGRRSSRDAVANRAPKKKPTIDKKRCEDASSCGALTAIPASPLWLVHTANSRGDFYHETRTLWDPATGEYVRRNGAKLVRSKALPAIGDAETDYGGLRVSPTGVLTIEGDVFDAAKVHYAPKSTEAGVPTSCGWVGGGWRIPGPTDG
jgi:hypothetical protein